MLRQITQILVIVTLLSYAVVDATLAFTAPLGVDWKAGTKNIITWVDNGDGKGMPATVDLSLLNGPASALQLIANVASNVSTAPGSYEWTIPTDIQPGQYVLRAGGGDGSYSPFFTISAPDANATTTSSASVQPTVIPVNVTTSTAPVSTSESYAATITVTTTTTSYSTELEPTAVPTNGITPTSPVSSSESYVATVTISTTVTSSKSITDAASSQPTSDLSTLSPSPISSVSSIVSVSSVAPVTSSDSAIFSLATETATTLSLVSLQLEKMLIHPMQQNIWYHQ
ncbi:hypothetical protein K7432_008516 [Basidiobolus ranarum]|uniref:Yeast cell wall synthesis Kre9/Knh1-like N-terminal domain-containing protein n=1 Tax=Basidiobolus ranarum TaxID=34480 RepID=A0ABR2VYH3_9FUNG